MAAVAFALELRERTWDVSTGEQHGSTHPVKPVRGKTASSCSEPRLQRDAFLQHAARHVERLSRDVDHRHLKVGKRKSRIQLQASTQGVDPFLPPRGVAEPEVM